MMEDYSPAEIAKMERYRWEYVKESIREIGDFEYQKRVWPGRDPDLFSSFSEVLNTTFSDNNALEYCEEGSTTLEELGVGPLGRAALCDFLKRLHEFGKDFDPYASVEKVQAEPRWVELSKEARRLLPLLGDVQT